MSGNTQHSTPMDLALTKPLTPMEQWMVKSNLKTLEDQKTALAEQRDRNGEQRDKLAAALKGMIQLPLLTPIQSGDAWHKAKAALADLEEIA